MEEKIQENPITNELETDSTPENPVEAPQPESEIIEPIPPIEPVAVSDSTPAPGQSTVLVIPRYVFNYVVIAIVFFALGAGITALGYNSLFDANNSENQRLLDQAISRTVAELGVQQVAAGPQLVPDNRYDISPDDGPVRGAEDALITIVEFSDFRCQYCGRFVAETLNPLMEDYEGKIRLVYRDFPILGVESFEAALAGECANAQGKFWEFHDVVFANQQLIGRDFFITVATGLELDVENFTACFDEQLYRDAVIADYTYAQNLGATGTPAFFVNGRFVSGAQPYAVFADIINEELAALENGSTES